MWVSKPKNILVNDLVSTNIPVGSESEYVSTTAYTTGAIVKVSFAIDGTTPLAPVYTYKALTGSTGKYPPTNIVEWEQQATTNRWAMFDYFLNTESISPSTNPGTIDVTLNSSGQNSIYLFGLTGTSVTFSAYDSSSTLIATTTIPLTAESLITDWYQYYFNDFETVSSCSWDFPLYLVSTLRVVITNTRTGEYAKCGRVSLGNKRYLGDSEYGLSKGITDFSKIETNSFGLTFLNVGSFVDRFEGDIIIDNTTYDTINKLLTDLRATPAVFDGNNEGSNFKSLIVFGYLSNWNTVISNFAESQISIEISGIQGLLI